MSTSLVGSRPPSARLRPLLGGWFLIVLFLSACATGVPPGGRMMGRSYRYRSLAPPLPPQERVALAAEPGLESATVYAVDFLEPGAVATGPVPINKAEFQRAFLRLSREVRLGRRTPKEAAREMLSHLPQQPQDVETVASKGDWNLEAYRGEAYTLVPEKQEGLVRLTPVADEALKARYLKWCEHQGGGDCLGLLDDGPYLRTDDRRTLALALAFGTVLDETRAALGRELLNVEALVSMVVWTVALYCMMWVVPEPASGHLC